MTTHKDRLVGLLFDMGVVFQANDTEVIIDDEGPKNDGYNGFYTLFQFTPDGELLRVGAWE